MSEAGGSAPTLQHLSKTKNTSDTAAALLLPLSHIYMTAAYADLDHET